MKKRLFLLPLVGGFLLSGCTFNLFGKEITINFPWEKAEKQEGEGGGGSGGGSGEGSGGSGGGSGEGGGGGSGGQTTDFSFPEADSTVKLVIDKEDIAPHIPSGKTYPDSGYSFTTDNVEFSCTAGVGIATSQSGANFYFESDIIQIRSASNNKGGGVISTNAAISGSKLTLNWVATYSSQDANHQPFVKVGDSASDISTRVSCNEGESVNGKATGKKQKSGDKEYDVYFYQTTYNLSGKSYFSIAAPNNAFYLRSAWLHN